MKYDDGVNQPFSDEFLDYGTVYESPITSRHALPDGRNQGPRKLSDGSEILSSEDIIVSDLNKDHGLLFLLLRRCIRLFKSVAVFVENGEHGSSVAGPIAKQVIDTYLLDISD